MVTLATHMDTNLKDKIVFLLADANTESVEKFASYCQKLKNEKNYDGTLKNKFMQAIPAERLVELYRGVQAEGLEFDGKHVTIQSTGVSYDYVAYKNKMFLAYPESLIDIDVVKEGDVFSFSKDNGSVIYKHEVTNPFVTAGEETIIGAYCVIRNKRGDFLTLLSKEEIEKHRKVAKTDKIWVQWFKEMTMKTVIKKACKYHFDDIFKGIEAMDNDNYELDNPLDLSIEQKQEIDALDTLEQIQEYYNSHSGGGKAFDKYIGIRKSAIEAKVAKIENGNS